MLIPLRNRTALCQSAREKRLTVCAATITDGVTHLAITYQHSLNAGSFDNDRKDPCDRMLAAQSIIEGATLVSGYRTMKLFTATCL